MLTRSPKAVGTKRVVFDPANVCIYCGERSTRLSEEHVVPYALGGHLIIPNASCQDCQRRINPFETLLARESYALMRAVYRYPSRTKTFRETHPFEFTTHDGKVFTRHIPLSRAPVTVVLPRFPLPPFVDPSLPWKHPKAGLTIRHLTDDEEHKRRWNALLAEPNVLKVSAHTGAHRVVYNNAVIYKMSIGLLWLACRAALARSQVREKLLRPPIELEAFGDLFSAPAGPATGGYFRARVFAAPERAGSVGLYTGIHLFVGFEDVEHFCRICDVGDLDVSSLPRLFP